MPRSEGIVTKIDKDGRARVMVQFDQAAQGGSSRDARCHCSASSPNLTVSVLNPGGAKTGDHVSVRFQPGAALKSISILLGIPLVGMVGGVLLGTGLSEANAVSTAQAITAGVALFGAAVLVGALAYRKVSRSLQPYIETVIAAAADTLSPFAIDPVCKMKIAPLKAAARTEYHGRPYYFCHSACLEAFLKDPGEYLD
jgi:YHS domain-containing protein/positive regulator of sigma E activity